MVRKFPPFRSERKKRSTSEGTPQFPNGISGKLPYHLSSNRNFRIFWPNGKHPRTCKYPEHKGERKAARTDRAFTLRVSREVMEMFGVLVPVGAREYLALNFSVTFY